MTGLIALTIGVAATTASAANSRYAAIVVDANTGKTLFSANAGARRYPASLTKMMTLYLTFEAMKRGKINKSTPVKFSAQAAAQPPTKLGVKAGGSITVETAIYSLITRSANDSSVALAELLGGSEANFATMMTKKARSLGMTGTVFRNPHGLPNTSQFSTARDMATLGIALREHFPQYYSYFSVRSFKYGRQRIANHNRLLGKVKGVDGIKTGYTRASGFNLVSSVTDGNRRIVAVVMGGTSGSARDKHMAQLIAKYMPKASSRKGGPLVAKAGSSTFAALADMLPGKQDQPVVSLAEETDAIANEQPTEADQAVLEPVRPKKQLKAAKARGDAQAKREIVDTETAIVEQAYAAPEPRPSVELDSVATATISNSASSEPSGWVIQIASSPSKAEAAKALDAVKNKASALLASASSYTVPFEKGGVIYHRARFGGFDSKTVAMKTCTQLKKKKIACYAVQN
jgi:D-alanyl-D-alanine carboxypeptidase